MVENCKNEDQGREEKGLREDSLVLSSSDLSKKMGKGGR